MATMNPDDPQFDRIQQAVEALIARDTVTARKLLVQELHENPNNESAWMIMSSVVTEKAKKIDCLSRVLQINPNNHQARQALHALENSTLPQPPPAARAEEISPNPEETGFGGKAALLDETSPIPEQPSDLGEVSPINEEPSLGEVVPSTSAEPAVSEMTPPLVEGEPYAEVQSGEDLESTAESATPFLDNNFLFESPQVVEDRPVSAFHENLELTAAGFEPNFSLADADADPNPDEAPVFSNEGPVSEVLVLPGEGREPESTADPDLAADLPLTGEEEPTVPPVEVLQVTDLETPVEDEPPLRELVGISPAIPPEPAPAGLPDENPPGNSVSKKGSTPAFLSLEKMHPVVTGLPLAPGNTGRIALGVIFFLIGMLAIAGGAFWFYVNAINPTSPAGAVNWLLSFGLPMGVAVIGLVLVIVTGYTLYRALDYSLSVSELNREGRKTNGVVIRKERGEDQGFWFVCQFVLHPKSGGEEVFQVRQSVEVEMFSHLSEGSPVVIRYLSRNPRLARVEWDETSL